MYCDADVEVAELGELLHEKLGMDVVGLTTTATVERYAGYNDMGILLIVLTADDVDFSAVSTGELQKDSFPDAICSAYKEARAALSEDPRFILMLSPYVEDITSENYVELLEQASGGVPIFGGVATDHYDLQYQKTFFNGEEYTRGLVFVLLSGNVQPAFAMEHHFGAKVERKGIITKSNDNLVQEVDGMNFKEFVASMVPVPDDDTVIYQFQSTPFVMELPDYEEDEQPVVRALCAIDHETGTGGFLSKMPEGSALYLNVLERDHLSLSCKGALSALAQKMNENKEYQYSMIFVSTCNARHLLMGDAKNLESDIISEAFRDLPPEVNVAGFYGFGEMCPTGIRDDGTAKNRFHNISFAVCAI